VIIDFRQSYKNTVLIFGPVVAGSTTSNEERHCAMSQRHLLQN